MTQTIEATKTPQCPECKGRTVKCGRKYRRGGRVQIYLCTECARSFVETTVRPKRAYAPGHGPVETPQATTASNGEQSKPAEEVNPEFEKQRAAYLVQTAQRDAPKSEHHESKEE